MDFSKINFEEINKVAENLKKTKDELLNTVETGEAGGGFVKVQLNGNLELLNIEIDKDLLDPSRVSILVDLIKSAHIDAYEKIKNKIGNANPYNMDLSNLDLSSIMNNFFKKDN